ncbi:MAG: glycosyltransferase family A protein [Candidatus Sulfotelmatobacter sp.]|jgi:succinoglycan biosynthesis protein ExoM
MANSLTTVFSGTTDVSVPEDATAVRLSHISVCICTYKRPDLLRRLLDNLADQETGGIFTYSIVIVDNDGQQSAKNVITEFNLTAAIAIKYRVELRQNIAMARNKAVESSEGDYIAFIDDDEFPEKTWLLTLLKACQQYKVDGVLGPVKRYFDEQPPQWIIKGNFYERPTYPTGLIIDWRKGRTGNVLLKKQLFTGAGRPFDPQFRQGEDQDFFRRMIEQGHVFIWCNEAVAYEVVPPVRWRRVFMLKRALLRGAMEPQTANFGALDIGRSVAAIPLYICALPFAFVAGQHRFMDLTVRLFDHLGKLLALAGVHIVKDQYVTE